jgi:hypothetical protein
MWLSATSSIHTVCHIPRDLRVPNPSGIEDLFTVQLPSLGVVFDTNDQRIFPWAQGIGDIHCEGGVSAGMLADDAAIDDHATPIVNRFEIE